MSERSGEQNLHDIGNVREMVFITRSDEMTIAVAAPPSEEELIQKYLQAAGAQLFETVATREDGINTERVDQFLRDHGLQPKSSLLIAQEEVPELQAAMADVGFNHHVLARLKSTEGMKRLRLMGGYIDILGVVVVVRSPEMEAVNGTAYTEHLLVHEKVHGAEDDSPIVYRKTKDGQIIFAEARSGQFVPKRSELKGDSFRGAFMEEAFAEMIAAKYTAEELNLPYGICELKDGYTVETGKWLPGVSWWKAPDGIHKVYGAASIAARGVDLIVRSKPALYDALIQARTSTEGKRKAAQIINSLRPGLYAELSKLQYNATDFSLGLQAIQAALADLESIRVLTKL